MSVAGLGGDNIWTVGAAAGRAIDIDKDILENGGDVIEKLAGGAVELPKNAFFARRQQGFLRTLVHQHFLEDLVEIEALIGRGLLVPFERAGFDVERNRGIAEKLVAYAASA